MTDWQIVILFFVVVIISEFTLVLSVLNRIDFVQRIGLLEKKLKEKDDAKLD